MCNKNYKTIEDCKHAERDTHTELIQCGKQRPLFCPYIIEKASDQADYENLFGADT